MPDRATPDRATLFIDGNNWYHFISSAGVTNPFRLSYKKISEKLCGPRVWIGTRYYIGALKQDWNPRHYADQRAFLSALTQEDPRITVHLGRLERRKIINPVIEPLKSIIASPRMNADLRKEIRALMAPYAEVETLQEKAVDVQLAVHMIEGASANEFDCAYLLSADGDFTPAVESLKRRGKKVYVASPGLSSQLRQSADAYIVLKEDWFSDCYKEG